MPYVIVALLVLLADQLSKYLTTIRIPLNTGSIDLIPGFLALRNIHNYGAAFGILKNARWFFLAVTVLLFAVAAYAFAKRIIHSKPTRWLAVLVLAGALGNAIDRLIHGYVVDMFQFVFLKNFAVFNVADIFITCGTILFCILIFFEKDPKEQAKKQKYRHSTVLADAGADASIDDTAIPETTAAADMPSVDAIDAISLDNVEDEVAAVFDSFSEEMPVDVTDTESAKPELAEHFESVETPEESEPIESFSASPMDVEPVDDVDSAIIVETPVVPVEEAVATEETIETTRPSSTDLSDLDNAEDDSTAETEAIPPSDDTVDLPEEEEEEVFSLADILAEFSDY